MEQEEFRSVLLNAAQQKFLSIFPSQVAHRLVAAAALSLYAVVLVAAMCACMSVLAAAVRAAICVLAQATAATAVLAALAGQ